MTDELTVKLKFHIGSGRKGHRVMQNGDAPEPAPAGRTPRVSRLMALAIRFDQLIRDGVVADQAEIARLGFVTRARVTQIMNLLNLSSELQGLVLFLAVVERGRDPITERDLRPIAAEPDWNRQRRMWDRLYSGR